jgi:hypothetical protein
MLIVLQDEPGLFVFPTVAAAERSIEAYDADSVVRAAFNEEAVPYRVDWLRPPQKRRFFLGLLNYMDPGEYRFVPAGPPDPDALASLIEKHPDFTNSPQARSELALLLSALRRR